MAVSDEVKIRILTDVAKSAKDMVAFGATVGGLYLAFKKVAAIITDVTQEFFKQEQAEAKLNAVLKATGGAAGITAKQMANMASEMQRTTVFGDDMVMSGQAVLATFTKIGKNVFPDAIAAAADMSTVMGQDLQSSIVQIGKALNDPIEGVSALRRVGVQLTEQQEKSIKAFMDQGKVMEAQRLILGELQTEFGGAAKAMGDTTYGATVKLTNAFGELKEAIGGVVAGGSSGILSNFADVFQQLALRINTKDMPEGLEKTTAQLETFRLEAKRLEQQAGAFPKGGLMDMLSRGPAIRRQLEGVNKEIEQLVRLQGQQARTATAADREKMKAIEDRAAALLKEQEALAAAEASQARVAQLNADWAKTDAGKIAAVKELIAYYSSPVFDQNAQIVKDVLAMYRAQLDELTKIEAVSSDWMAAFEDADRAASDALRGTKALVGPTTEIRDLLGQASEYWEIISTIADASMRDQYQTVMEMVAAEKERQSIAEEQVRLGNEYAASLDGAGKAVSAISDIISGDMQKAIQGLLSSLGPEGQLMAAVLEIGQKLTDIFRDPLGISESLIETISKGLEEGDWSSVEEALNAQIRQIMIDSAVKAGVFDAYAERLSRAISAYLRNDSDRNRDRVQDAYSDLLGAGQEVQGLLDKLTSDLGIGEIPQMASGGIVTKPTLAMIGEAGPEAVVPLGDGGVGTTVIINGSVLADRTLDSRIARAVARKGRGW